MDADESSVPNNPLSKTEVSEVNGDCISGEE